MQQIYDCEIAKVHGGYGEWLYDWMEIFVASLYDATHYHSHHYRDDDEDYYQEHYHHQIWSG